MYTTSERVLRRMGGLGQGGQVVGAAAGTAVLGPGIGTAVGTFIGGLFKGGAYTGPSVQAGLMNWAQTGQWAILQRIATTGMGPHWSQPDKYPDPPGITYGGTIGAGSAGPNIPPQSMATQQFAAWLVNTYGPGSSLATTVIPQNPAIGLNSPVTVNIPSGTARVGSVTTIAGEVAAVLTYVAQGQSLDQAIATAVAHGEVNTGDAASVRNVASQAQAGKTTATYGAAGILGSLTANPVLLLALVGGGLLLMRRR